jgi:hypothetical protein
MTTLDTYAHKFSTIRMERRDGILQVTFHTDGGPLRWGMLPHGEFPDAFAAIARDRQVGDEVRLSAAEQLASVSRSQPATSR